VNAADRADRTQAVTVPCTEPRCHAAAGEVCINVHTGQPLKYQAAHRVRLQAAGVQHMPWPAADLRRAD
jgi:hypothetical protein